MSLRAEVRCLAGPDQRWEPATIRRVFADGTCKVEFDEKHLAVFPYWYGVPPAEISLDDQSLWPNVFPQLTDGADLLTYVSFVSAWRRLGGSGTDEQLQEYWANNASARPGLGPREAYTFFRGMYLSAKWIDVSLKQSGRSRYTTFYWNLTRMGGRDPAEIARTVTVNDALAALGVSQKPIDTFRAAQIAAFEKQHALRLPQELKTILERKLVDERFIDCHPNNPSLRRITEWSLETDIDSSVEGKYAITIVEPHQGCHGWVAVFDPDDDVTKIYIHWESEGVPFWALTAPSAAMFIWDLAQTGLAWWDDTKHDGGRPIVTTDVGLAYDEGAGSTQEEKWYIRP